MAKCEKENVNEGEENAQFKAMHCALVRCPGLGSCVDPNDVRGDAMCVEM